MQQATASAQVSTVERPAGVATYDFSVSRLSTDEWSVILNQFDDATLYQSHAYGAVRWGEKRLRHAVLRYGGNVVAAAQVVMAGFPSVALGAAYAPSAPLWRRRGEAPQARHLEAFLSGLVGEFVRKRRSLLRLTPCDLAGNAEAMESLLRAIGFSQGDGAARQTIHLDLTQKLETLEAQSSKKWRENLRRSLRSDLELREGCGDELYEIFVQLYHQMHRRKQFSQSVSVEQFREIQKRLPPAQKMQIMLCLRNNAPVAGLVWSAIGDVGIPIFSATGDEGLKYRGSYLLRWTTLIRMKERGCRILDQGGVNREKNPGGYHFKSGMGGRLVQPLGRFDLCENPPIRWALSFTEWSRKWRRHRGTPAGPNTGEPQTE